MTVLPDSGLLELLGRQSGCDKWLETKASSFHHALSSFPVWSQEFPGLSGLIRDRAPTSRYILKVGASEWQGRGAWSCTLGDKQDEGRGGALVEASLPVGDSKKAKEALGKK